MTAKSKVKNADFDPLRFFDRQASGPKLKAWYLIKIFFFLSAFPWPSPWKVRILRAFGSRVAPGTVIKPRVNIHFPWKLTVGDDTWIGEQVEIYNFEPITIGANCCISQRAFLCAGNHDYRDPAMSYRNAPITIEDGAWIGACSFVGPGVKIGVDVVVTAGSIVTKDLPDGMICGGHPCVPTSPRWR